MNLLAFTKTFAEIFSGPIAGITWEDELVALLRVVIAGLIGLVMGFERKRRQKEAGLATHFIVASASALFTCISTSISTTAVGVDGERIAAQVVSGVGFLGAGMIFFRRESLRGLTTAAGIWATAALGMCVAVGQIVVALGVLALILLVQTALHSKRIRRNNLPLLLVKFDYNNEIKTKLTSYFGFEGFHRFKITKTDNGIVAEAVIHPRQHIYAQELSDFMSENAEIISIERLEDL